MALANDIGELFVQKVKDIHSKLDTSTPSFSIADSTISGSAEVSLTEFNTLSVGDVRKLISRSAKSSLLDPMPTLLVVQCLDELLPVITAVINVFKERSLCRQMEGSNSHPLLKKHGTKLLFKTLRPVSNLAFISKLFEITCLAMLVPSPPICI